MLATESINYCIRRLYWQPQAYSTQVVRVRLSVRAYVCLWVRFCTVSPECIDYFKQTHHRYRILGQVAVHRSRLIHVPARLQVNKSTIKRCRS